MNHWRYLNQLKACKLKWPFLLHLSSNDRNSRSTEVTIVYCRVGILVLTVALRKSASCSAHLLPSPTKQTVICLCWSCDIDSCSQVLVTFSQLGSDWSLNAKEKMPRQEVHCKCLQQGVDLNIDSPEKKFLDCLWFKQLM